MSKHVVIVIFVFFTILSSVSLAKTPASHLDLSLAPPYTRSGGAEDCAPMNLTQALNRPIEWRAGSVVNTSSTRDVWVTCPLTRNFFSDSGDSNNTYSVAIPLVNYDMSPRSILCILKEFDFFGQVLQTVSRSVEVSYYYRDLVYFDYIEVSEYDSYFSVACRLKPNTGLLAIHQGDSEYDGY